MRLYTFGNGGGIDSVIEDIKNNPKTFKSINEALDYIVYYSNKFSDNDFFIKQDLSIKYYCKDERIGKTVYVICTDRFGDENYIEKYKSPQFIRYMIDLDEHPHNVKNINIDHSEGNCPTCGLKVTRKEDVHFCGTCGTPINWR